MTYKELKDSIKARYRMDCNIKGLQYTEFQDKWVYQLITQAESNIQRRVVPLSISLTADIGTDYADPLPNNGAVAEAEQYWVYFPYDQLTMTWDGVGDTRQGYNALLYGLPSDFGKMRQISTSNQDELEYKTPEEFALLEKLGGDEKYYTTYRDGTSNVLKMYPAPDNTSMTLFYFKAIIPFIDNSLTESSNLQLAPDYYTAIELKVMSNIFPEYLGLYEQEIRGLREYESVTKHAFIEGTRIDD